MVGTPPHPRPSQLGHGVYLRSAPVAGKKRVSLGWSPTRGLAEDFTLSVMFLYSALKERRVETIGTKCR